MIELTQKLKQLKPYEPVKHDCKDDIILDANESFYSLPHFISAKVKRAMNKMDFNRYPDPYAQELCKAFGKVYSVNCENIVAGNGSDELISIIVNAFLEKDDKILCLSPDFSMYSFYAKMNNIDVLELDKDNDYEIKIDDIINRANEAKLIIFSNPCNPTGKAMLKEDIVKLLKCTGALVVVDEAYMEFFDSKESLLFECGEYDNLIVLKTLSKAWGLAALRVGFAVSNNFITEQIKKAKSPYNVNAFSQKAGQIVLENKEYADKCILKIVNNKNELYKDLLRLENEKFRVLTTYTNFVVVKTHYAKQICDKLLKKRIYIKNVNDEFLRITTGSKKENKKFLQAFESAVREI